MESRLLRVNLTTRELKSEIIPHSVFEKWIGGSGINNWIMWEHFLTHDINCDPRGAENIFVFGVEKNWGYSFESEKAYLSNGGVFRVFPAT